MARMAKARLRNDATMTDVADQLRHRARQYRRKGYEKVANQLEAEALQAERLGASPSPTALLRSKDYHEESERSVEQLADRVVATLRQRSPIKPPALWDAVGEVSFTRKKAVIDLLVNDGVIVLRQDGIALRT